MAKIVNTNIVNQYDGYVTDAENIKGGMINVDSVANLPTGKATIVNGSVAFVKDVKKFYAFNGSTWEELQMGGGGSSGETIELTLNGLLAENYNFAATKELSEEEYLKCIDGNNTIKLNILTAWEIGEEPFELLKITTHANMEIDPTNEVSSHHYAFSVIFNLSIVEKTFAGIGMIAQNDSGRYMMAIGGQPLDIDGQFESKAAGNVTFSTWTASTAYADYPFECQATVAALNLPRWSQVTFADVVLPLDIALSGKVAPVCYASILAVGGMPKVTIYSKEQLESFNATVLIVYSN